MKILVAGGSGFVGSALVSLLKQQHQVVVLTRSLHSSEELLNWKNLATVNGYDVVINLSGENISAKRWIKSNKKIILSSRIDTTLKIAHLCAIAKEPKPRLLNASAIGIYGLQQEQTNQLPIAYDEHSPIDFMSSTDFLSQIARSWEQATLPALNAGCEVTWLRFGVILDPSGGALKKILPAFKLGLGSVLGSGNQPFSWTSRTDAIRAIQFIIDQRITGPVCIVAPEAITQREFATTLSKQLGRPCLLHMPSFLIKTFFGQMGDELLLRGQHVKPSRLQELGFSFQATNISEALKQMINS